MTSRSVVALLAIFLLCIFSAVNDITQEKINIAAIACALFTGILNGTTAARAYTENPKLWNWTYSLVAIIALCSILPPLMKKFCKPRAEEEL